MKRSKQRPNLQKENASEGKCCEEPTEEYTARWWWSYKMTSPRVSTTNLLIQQMHTTSSYTTRPLSPIRKQDWQTTQRRCRSQTSEVDKGKQIDTRALEAEVTTVKGKYDATDVSSSTKSPESVQAKSKQKEMKQVKIREKSRDTCQCRGQGNL